MERDEYDKNYNELEKNSKKKDKTIRDLIEKVVQFEEVKLKWDESQEKLGKLYELGVIDSQGDCISIPPEDRDDMR